MASIAKKALATAEAFTGNATTSAVSLDARTDDYILFMNITALGAATSLVVTVQHSPDGTNWFTLVAFTAAVATGTQIRDQASFATAGANIFPNMRLSLAFTGGATTATLTCELYYDPRK
mgnify:CR=1 FL=1